MILLWQARAIAAGLVFLLVLACWVASPASAQVDRGNLVVSGSPSPEPAGSASQVTYTINVKNDSTVSVTGLAVTMGMPAGAQFVSCTTANPSGQPCQESLGIVTATFAIPPIPAISAHSTVKVTLKINMPAVSTETHLSLAVLAHADGAVNGVEPRDGTLTINSTVLPPTSRLMMSPSGRTVPVGCGSTVDAATFGADTEGQLLDGLVCNNGSGLTFTAGGKILNLGGKKISSGQRVTGNAGIIVGPNAANVTIKGGGTSGTMGIEQFEYCIKDLGGNTGMYVTGLRCFRAKGAGILTLSNGVLIENSLIDNTIPDSKIEVPGGGIGIEAGGDNLHVKDTIVRRSANIGFWAYGVDADGSGRVATYDGNTATSRIESNFGIGVRFSGGPHQMKATQVQGDDSQVGTSMEGIVIEATAGGTILDSVVVKKHHGHAISVEAGAAGTVIARTSVEDIGGSGFVINAPSTLSGNSAALVVGDAFVVNAAATLTSNSVENCSGNAFVVNGATLVDSNSAVDNAGYGFVLTNTSPGILGKDWSVQGVGDFDGNGKADILWRQTSGAVFLWLMDGAVASSTASLGTVAMDWTIAAVGDFNGDGKADILWRHTSGAVFLWLMNGPVASSTASLGAVTMDWTIAAVGDFNGDGKADILWRHTSGAVFLWLMNGTVVSSTASLGTVGTDWTIADVGDFNGDGKADILWRRSSGELSTWLMNGTSVLAASGGARLRSNTAEGNALGGFLVSGSGNVLEGNNAKTSGAQGFDISGSGNLLNTNAAERSTGSEFVIGPNNVDDGSNSANGTRFSFPAAGGTFE